RLGHLDEGELFEHRTLRTDSPSSWVAAVIAWMRSEGSNPAARPPLTMTLENIPSRASPLAETRGLECRRGGAVIGVGATCAPLTQGESLTPAWRSIAWMSRAWRRS